MSSYRKKQPQPRPAPARPEWQEQLAQQSGEATYNNPGVDKVIHSSRLISGQAYQRPVREENANDLIQRWDETMLEPVVVSFRDGKFYVIDGQNRISAMRKMNGGHEVMVVCNVLLPDYLEVTETHCNVRNTGFLRFRCTRDISGDILTLCAKCAPRKGA